MQIEFYEEFPTKNNLEKLKLISFPTKLFIAAKSIKDFRKTRVLVGKIKKNCVVAYWPIIKDSYYISPFSNTKNLIESFKILGQIKNPLLIDMEIPLKKSMILKNLFSFRKNKKPIKKFLEENKNRITVPMQVSIPSFKIMELLGLSYNIAYEKNPMFYTSMMPKWLVKRTKKNLAILKNKESYAVGLGTIDTGIKGNEKILSPANLERDLSFCKSMGFNKVIIFRFGGLNKEYIKVLNKFI
jgi:hypothetical protein